MTESMSALFEGKEVLVTGGAGFMGGRLSARLVELGAHVVTTGVSRSVGVAGAQHEVVDQLDKASLATALAGHRFSYVFNLAGYISHAPLGSGGRAVLDVHFDGLLNVVEVVGGPSLLGFVQVGSSDEYGDAESPLAESLRESPISPYSLAKMAATHLMQMLAHTDGFPGVAVRLFLTYGPGQDDRRFLPQVIKGCLNDTSFPTSEGHQIRDFCYVEDVVDGLLLAATTEQARGEVINIASGQPVRIRHVVESVQRIMGKGTPRFGEVPYRPGESMSLYADVRRAREVLGWSPTTTLEDGLGETISHFTARG